MSVNQRLLVFEGSVLFFLALVWPGEKGTSGPEQLVRKRDRHCVLQRTRMVMVIIPPVTALSGGSVVMVSRRNSSVMLCFEGNNCSSQALFSKLGIVSKKIEIFVCTNIGRRKSM